MNSDDFYLTLPSNSEGSNTTSQFQVNLPQNISLDDAWEVALVDLIYPLSWNNIQRADQGTFTVCYGEEKLHVKIPVAHYRIVDDILGRMTQEMEELRQTLKEKKPPKI